MHGAGELLKKKAAQGVRVCIMVWDDKSSVNMPALTGGSGMMMPHDEDTRRYFRGTQVGHGIAAYILSVGNVSQ